MSLVTDIDYLKKRVEFLRKKNKSRLSKQFLEKFDVKFIEPRKY